MIRLGFLYQIQSQFFGVSGQVGQCGNCPWAFLGD